MSTTQVQIPNVPIRVSQTVFDIDAREDVQLVKTGDVAPVSTMNEFVSRLGNDSALILRLCNAALIEYAKEELEQDETKPYMAVESDDEGNETLVPFTGTALSMERSKQLNANVVNMAKLLFGFDKNMVPGDKTANREAKKVAKSKALDMILSNPAVIEALKK